MTDSKSHLLFIIVCIMIGASVLATTYRALIAKDYQVVEVTE